MQRLRSNRDSFIPKITCSFGNRNKPQKNYFQKEREEKSERSEKRGEEGRREWKEKKGREEEEGGSKKLK